MKKVTWLSKQEMFGSTVIVGIFAVLISAASMFNAPLARNQISPPSVSIKNEPFSPVVNYSIILNFIQIYC